RQQASTSILFSLASGPRIGDHLPLKKSILHRKNSLYYRSASGAEAGDVYMTLIHTCELNRINPYQYLVASFRHADDVSGAWEFW
ncbi:MAG: transposase domain-containing protein, partial [Planctomycetota bacterium]